MKREGGEAKKFMSYSSGLLEPNARRILLRSTGLYWALPGSASLEQGRSWLNLKATSTLLLAAPKRAYCGTNSQKRRSTRLHRSLH